MNFLKNIFKKKSTKIDDEEDTPNYFDVVLSLDNENRIFFNFYREGNHTLYENLTDGDKEIATQLLIQGTAVYAKIQEQSQKSQSKKKKYLS